MSGVWRRFAVWLAAASLCAICCWAPAWSTASKSVSLDFRPSKHGFAFRNSFPGYPPPLDGLDLPELPDVPSSYGLCGGMCFAAADYFYAKRPIAKDDKPPASGSTLHEYLAQRQCDSFGDVGEVILEFLLWMANDGDEEDGVWHDTYQEMQRATRKLDKGQLVVLGLVIADTEGTAEIWDNHQVLAYGYSRPSADELIVNVYDPNYPKRDDITLNFRRVKVDEDGDDQPIFGYRCSEESQNARIREIRGAFVIAYVHAVPPHSR